jgi:hypothetical protein
MNANKILITTASKNLNIIKEDYTDLYIKISMWVVTDDYNFDDDDIAIMKKYGLMDRTGKIFQQVKDVLLMPEL